MPAPARAFETPLGLETGMCARTMALDSAAGDMSALGAGTPPPASGPKAFRILAAAAAAVLPAAVLAHMLLRRRLRR
jgi:hypothetical protein